MTDTNTIKTPLWEDLLHLPEMQPININIIKTIAKFYKGVIYENREIELYCSPEREIYIKDFKFKQYFSKSISDYISLKETIEKNGFDPKKYRKSFIKETLKKLNLNFDDKIINFSIYTNNDTIKEFREHYFNNNFFENLFENNH